MRHGYSILLVSMISIFYSLGAYAAGTCSPKGGVAAQEGFCGPKSESECRVHAGVCSWTVKEEKAVSVVVSEKQNKCVAKDGSESHEAFCNNHNKAICKVHAMCEWK